ncbi:MAG: NAD(P)-dependent oxidoreductase [Candidatus Latescibacterota bacterium]
MSKRRRSRKIYPVGLLIEGRPCLVVGGGKTAARKARRLVEAGGHVKVVSPETGFALRELVDNDQVTLLSRSFEDQDVVGSHLVFAATDDAQLNQRILDLCNAHHILCARVDHGWPGGDFLVPASFGRDDLVVSVSTGGRSCRRARMISANLARHVALTDSADLLVMGLAPRKADPDPREQFALSDEKMRYLGDLVAHVAGVHEFMILSTCTRCDLMAVVAMDPGIERILSRLFGFDAHAADGLYVKRGFDAFSHLSFVAAGLYPHPFGDSPIVAQVKTALRISAEQGWSRGAMPEWIEAALHVSNAIRLEWDARNTDPARRLPGDHRVPVDLGDLKRRDQDRARTQQDAESFGLRIAKAHVKYYEDICQHFDTSLA